jgi:hypothetical protein
MDWVPSSAWLSQLTLNSSVASQNYDLTIDATSRADPRPVNAGLVVVGLPLVGLLALRRRA